MQGLECRHRRISPVEAKCKLIPIALEILRFNAVIRSAGVNRIGIWGEYLVVNILWSCKAFRCLLRIMHVELKKTAGVMAFAVQSVVN